jgi:hypothetical protein
MACAPCQKKKNVTNKAQVKNYVDKRNVVLKRFMDSRKGLINGTNR